METIRTDVVVIGAGPGGYVAAIRCGQLGRQVVCVEREMVGGVCLNVGCIPSKALISAAKHVDKLRHGEAMGISAVEVRVDVGKVQAFKQGVVDKLTSGVQKLLKSAGVKLMMGEARLAGPGHVEVATREGVVMVETGAIILATGSRPMEVPGFKVDNRRIHDSTGGLLFKEVPRRLLVIGGGYIGLELGTMWRKLGAEVKVVEFMDQLLPGSDPELVGVVLKKLKKMGVEVHLLHQALRCESVGGEDGALRVWIAPREQKDRKGEVAIECDHVLCTVGRRPNTEGLGLKEAGVRLDERGFIAVDRQQRTSVPGVYAIGDVCGQPMLAHKASREAEVAAAVICGQRAEMDAVAIPAVIFTDPEIGSVGLSEQQAGERGHKVRVGKYPFAALGRAMAVMETEGFVKVVADDDTKQVLGVHIVGPAATDLISEGVLALEMGAFLPDLALSVHPHPTLGEAIMEAAKAALGESPHLAGGGRR